MTHPQETGSVIRALIFVDPGRTPLQGGSASSVPRFGAFRAQWSLLRALADHRTVSKLTLVCQPHALRQLRRWCGEGSDVEVVDYISLADFPPVRETTVIQHLGQVFDAVPHRLRTISQSRGPVLQNHHTLSYPHLVDAAQTLNRHPTSRGDTIVTSSLHGAAILRSIVSSEAPSWPGRFVTIPWPVDVTPPTPAQRAAARHSLNLRPSDVCLLSLGRLSRHDKGTLEPLLWVRSQLEVPELSHVRLVIAGEDRHGYAAELRRQARVYGVAETVDVTPDVNDEERLQLLHGADMFVSLYDSHQEIFGLAVAEALAVGLPCVVSRFGNIGNLVAHGRNGFSIPTTLCVEESLVDAWQDLLPWENAHLHSAQLVAVSRPHLLEAVQQLVNDPELRKRMGQKAAHQASREFSSSNITRQYERQWARALQEGGGNLAAPERSRLASPLLAGFASVHALVGWTSWLNSPGVPWTELLGTDLVERLGLTETIEPIVRSLQPGGERVDLDALRHTTGLPDGLIRLTLAVLAKYGYVEIGPLTSLDQEIQTALGMAALQEGGSEE